LSFPPVDEQFALIRRGTVDLVHETELRARLEHSRASGHPLRVKLGIDPSSPDLHLGHTVVLRKLRDFQRLGHTAVLLWGTATAMVGDPTGRNKTRPTLTREQVEANKQTYREQVSAVLDITRIEERENGEWFDRMSFMDCIKLAGRYTVARILERNDFAKRYGEGQPVSMHELMYPLLQGFDSVELKADVELGGTDQLFNLMVGRTLQEQSQQRPQVCVTTPLLEGLDGSQKMSKSLGNYIAVRDAAGEMFGKLMRVPNELMEKYFTLLTDLGGAQIGALLRGHPLEAKFTLARAITAGYHGEGTADAARTEYDRMHQQGGVPDVVPEVRLDAALLREGRVMLAAALAAAGLCTSNGEGKRLIEGSGVRIDGAVVADPRATLGSGSYLVQAGKRKAARITVP
jgi:tyrosyl-tRNA synthetase